MAQPGGLAPESRLSETPKKRMAKYLDHLRKSLLIIVK